jgi:hypothetical protein
MLPWINVYKKETAVLDVRNLYAIVSNVWSRR